MINGKVARMKLSYMHHTSRAQLHNVLVSGALLQYIMSILQNHGVHLFIL